jgi:thiol-disulfide isomerase/thioredoxin
MRRFALGSLVALVALTIAAVGVAGPKDAELEIGKKGPAFKLVGTDGEKHALAGFVKESDATVIVFTCNSCPYSKGYEPVLLEMAQSYADKPVSFVLINSNAVEVQPKDSFDLMVQRAKERGFPFPYLYDESQEAANAYGAQRTPHVFVLDAKGVLRYRGRIDDDLSREKVSVHDLSNAIEALLAGADVPVTTTKAFGCTIKWKKTSS